MSVTKNWIDEYGNVQNKFGLRPEVGEVEFKLYRATDNPVTSNSTWEEVTNSEGHTKFMKSGVTGSDNTTSTWEFTYSKLLAYSEGNSKYTYKVVEVYNDTTLGAYEALVSTNPDTYSRPTNPSEEVHCVADNNNHTVFTNRLITRDITVNKVWNEQWGSGENAVNFGNSLRYNNTFTLSSEGIGYSKTESQSSTGSSVTFTGLPKYSKNHNAIGYKLVEQADGMQDSTVYSDLDGEYQQKSRKSGYVGTCVKTDLSGETGVVDYYTVTNTLPLIHFTASKKWNDDNNRDGLRPTGSEDTGTFSFSLSQNSTQIENNSVNETSWSTVFGYYPQYKPDNSPYDYDVTESGASEFKHKNKYTESSSSEKNTAVNEMTNNIQTETQYDYSFANTHDPYKGKIDVKKSWVGDTDYAADTRPGSIKVELWCRYKYKQGDTDVYSPLVRASEANYVRYFGALGANFQFIREISGDNNSNDWSLENAYTNLPLNVNVEGNTSNYSGSPNPSISSNGSSYPIEYYIKEVNAETNNLTGYSVSYTHPEEGVGIKLTNNGTIEETVTNTLKTMRFEVNKQWIDNNHTPTNEFIHFDVDVQITSSQITSYVSHDGKKQTIIKDIGDTKIFLNVPLYAKDGTAASYSVEELAAFQYGYAPSYYWDNNENLTNGSFTPSDDSLVKTKDENETQVKYIPITVRNTLPETSVKVTKNSARAKTCKVKQNML